MRRFFLILTLTTALFAYSYPGYEAKAVDPVTIAILTPIAIQLARVMLPYVLRGLSSMGRTGVKAGAEFLQFFRLPYGLGLCLFFRWKSGLKNMGLGLIAPFKMAFYVVMMPFSGITGAF